MTRFALFLASLALATAAVAQTATLPDVPDTDENGTWSLVELQAVWPELTEEGFAGIDLNVDGQVDATELQTAVDNGVITLPAAETEASGG
ncbi:EF-hand domain-containing protein [Tabrizicola aquatica]|uniref:EF-hand domain-containing protein n=1 Tax=Tabrizicola aquatica TaxID=909926 RepID=UPI0011AEF154|nr:EF-hand domain-containing protein [Tabrizicola aquatica]